MIHLNNVHCTVHPLAQQPLFCQSEGSLQAPERRRRARTSQQELLRDEQPPASSQPHEMIEEEEELDLKYVLHEQEMEMVTDIVVKKVTSDADVLHVLYCRYCTAGSVPTVLQVRRPPCHQAVFPGDPVHGGGSGHHLLHQPPH